MFHYQSVPLLHIELHLELVGGEKEGLDFVQVAEAVILGVAVDTDGDYRVAVAVDADGGVGVLLLPGGAVGDALLQ